MVIKIAINGFGRIGRLVFRAIRQRYPTECKIVAIHDLCDIKTNVHLLNYDSAHRKFAERAIISGEDTFELGEGENKWVVKNIGGKLGPSQLPWKEMGVDVVLESTGLFRKHAVKEGDKIVSDGYDGHIFAGAKKVVLSVPSADEIECTLVLGVNDEDLKPETKLISNASCTTNCLAPIVKTINDKFGVITGFMTTVHSYTNDQKVTDVMHKDLRRARSAATNIIPTSTGAAVALPRVIHGLAKGCMDGISLRVPTITGSLVDVSMLTRENVSKEQINDALKNACETPALKGIMEFTLDPIVSTDIIDDPHSSIVDGLSTMVIQSEKGSLVKILSWYDNEWMYSCRCADIFNRLNIFAEQQKQQQEISFPYKNDQQLNGILKYLSDRTNGNIHSNGTVEIQISKLCCGKIESLVDFNSGGWTHVNGQPCPYWLQIDFKSRKIQIDNYLIKANDSNDNRHIRSWWTEISNDGTQWEKIDEQNEVTDLNGNGKTKSFKVEMTKPFRFFRLISNKPNFQNDDGYVIGKLELFGNIVSE